MTGLRFDDPQLLPIVLFDDLAHELLEVDRAADGLLLLAGRHREILGELILDALGSVRISRRSHIERDGRSCLQRAARAFDRRYLLGCHLARILNELTRLDVADHALLLVQELLRLFVEIRHPHLEHNEEPTKSREPCKSRSRHRIGQGQGPETSGKRSYLCDQARLPTKAQERPQGRERSRQFRRQSQRRSQSRRQQARLDDQILRRR